MKLREEIMDMGQLVNSMMVDIETLGTKRDCVLMSAGIVIFNMDKVLDKFYMEFRLSDQILDGRTIDKGTVNWWKKTSIDTIKEYLEDNKGGTLLHLTDVIDVMWHKYKCKKVWSRGHIDIEVLEDVGAVPWRYFQVRDVRTLDEFAKEPMETNSHNALEDAENQVDYVREVLHANI